MPVMPGMMAGVTPPTAASNTFVQGVMGSTRGWCAVAERSPRRVAVRERENEGVEACGLHPPNLP